MAWSMRGTTLEACNCDAICPCRKIDGVPGGRSTHGICMGALSWKIEEGEVEGVDVSGLGVVLVICYEDDEPGSPWRWRMHLDARGDEAQREALDAVFTGRLGGTAMVQFPWARKPSFLLEVVASPVELDHTPGRGAIKVGDRVAMDVAGPFPTDSTVTCIIPGHDQPGREIVAGVLEVDDAPFSFRYEGVCGFESTFAYAG
jgi:hypothetical protein